MRVAVAEWAGPLGCRQLGIETKLGCRDRTRNLNDPPPRESGQDTRESEHDTGESEHDTREAEHDTREAEHDTSKAE